MKITVLAENTSLKETLPSEHGLSLYIETNQKKILFDMGQTALFADNAEKLGIHLADVDIAVLSHGHYDHGGGMRKFLEINQKAPVYLSRYAFGAYFHGPEKYIGLDVSLAANKRFIYTDDTVSMSRALHCIPATPVKNPLNSAALDLASGRQEHLCPITFTMNSIC